MIRFKLRTRTGTVRAYLNKRCIAHIRPQPDGQYKIYHVDYTNFQPRIAPNLEEAKGYVVSNLVAKRLEQS